MRPRSIDRGNLHYCSRERQGYVASMRPRSIDRGNLGEGGMQPAADVASMRPRSIDRGNAQPGRVEGAVRLASMRPRSIDRGNRPCLKSLVFKDLGGLLRASDHTDPSLMHPTSNPTSQLVVDIVHTRLRAVNGISSALRRSRPSASHKHRVLAHLPFDQLAQQTRLDLK